MNNSPFTVVLGDGKPFVHTKYVSEQLFEKLKEGTSW